MKQNNMPSEKPFTLGVIEGFYGRVWPVEQRLRMLKWLKSAGYSSYIYAPKQDKSLRGCWADPFTDKDLLALQALRKEASRQGVGFGLGLSPLGAVQSFPASINNQRCDAKLAQIKALGLDTLCILFDDMICSMPDLAHRQCEIVDYIRHRIGNCRIVMCPTYYSYDPVLERVFGDMPNGYWQQLGEKLDQDVGVFWTGNTVCSPAISSEDLENINTIFKRKVVIWDNYPVNDGAKASQFLHLKPFSGRDSSLASVAAGHYCNPMNQCELSKLALYSLPKLYAGSRVCGDVLLKEACDSVLALGLAELINEHVECFNGRGLEAIGAEERQRLISQYSQYESVAAEEVVDWLNDGYLFDPACLTEAME